MRYNDPAFEGTGKQWCGPNDGGIKRGDRAVTGDEAARPNQNPDEIDPDAVTDDIDDLTIRSSDDGSLGLTNIGNKPPEDWAADTGPTDVGNPDEEDAVEWEPVEPNISNCDAPRKRKSPQKS